ncbi:hypothetical protein [Roseovarius sp.]|uniref:hypothetical protein n=1 Tax=Roseovarius sp. TaxID=1486281 RepID=UPI003BA9E1B8
MNRTAAITQFALAGVVLALLTACVREDEAAMRARLEQWFALGETAYFQARGDCVAGVFRLAGPDVGAAMPVTGSVPEMLWALPRQGRAALRADGMAPDAALVELANEARPTGMAMRRAGLEARSCMDDGAEGAFRRALLSPDALLAYDSESGTVMVMDTRRDLLFAAMGEG